MWGQRKSYHRDRCKVLVHQHTSPTILLEMDTSKQQVGTHLLPPGDTTGCWVPEVCCSPAAQWPWTGLALSHPYLFIYLFSNIMKWMETTEEMGRRRGRGEEERSQPIWVGSTAVHPCSGRCWERLNHHCVRMWRGLVHTPIMGALDAGYHDPAGLKQTYYLYVSTAAEKRRKGRSNS